VGGTELVAHVGELDGHLALALPVPPQHHLAEAAHAEGLAQVVVVEDGAVVEFLA